MPFEMDQHNRTGIFLITILGLTATILVFLVVREMTFQPSPPPPKSTEIEPDPPLLESSTEWIFSPLPAPQAHPLKKSSNRLVGQWNDEGLALYTQGRYGAAAEQFRKALDQSPMDPVLQKNLAYAKGSLGWQLIELGRYLEALRNFQEAVQLDAEEAAFYMGIGLIHHQLKEEEHAIEMLKMAISQRFDYAQPYKLLGEIYYMRDEMDLAVGYFEKAAELDPNDYNLRQRLAKAQREQQTQGDFQRQATLHFTVKFEGREEHDVAREMIDLLEDAYREIGQALSGFPQMPTTVILYSNQQFRDVTLTPNWSQGLFDGKIRLPIEGFRKDPRLLRKVVYHEYTHAVVYDLSKGRPPPTWLNEGIALNLEGTSSRQWENLLLNHIQQGQNLIPLRHLDGSFMTFSEEKAALAYAQSYSATRYLIDHYGLYRIKELLLALAEESDFEHAFENQFMITHKDFERNWQEQIMRDAHEGT